MNSGVSYEISEAEDVDVGTKVVIHLKADCRKFSDESKVKEIVDKYSSFVSFPIQLNGNVLNEVKVSCTQWGISRLYLKVKFEVAERV